MFIAIAKLSPHPLFRDRVKSLNGISAIVYEIDRRRKIRQMMRRSRVDAAPEEYFTDVLLTNLRKDWAAVKIQAVVRSRRARRLVGRTLMVLGRQITGLVEMQGPTISYQVAQIFGQQEKKKTEKVSKKHRL